MIAGHSSRPPCRRCQAQTAFLVVIIALAAAVAVTLEVVTQ